MNIPTVETVRKDGRILFAVVTSGFPDNFQGSYWHLYDENGDVVSYGHSKGWSGDGAGSSLSAMKNAKAAATRYLKKEARGYDYAKNFSGD